MERDASWRIAKGKRKMREQVHTFKALLHEGCRPLANGVLAIPVVQLAPSAFFWLRYRAYPYQVIVGRKQATPLQRWWKKGLMSGQRRGFTQNG